MNDDPRRPAIPGAAPDVVPSQATLEAVVAAELPNCFMCGSGNPFGLKLRFEVQPDGSVLAQFACREMLQSYPDTLHGGIIAAALDTAMANAILSIGVVALTAELTVRYVASARLNRPAVVRGKIEKATLDSLYDVSAEFEQDGKVLARATARFLRRGTQ